MGDRLSVTLIDVGWGDSILVESEAANGDRRFGLVDCNDRETDRSALSFVTRHFQRTGFDYRDTRLAFEWVILTHGHDDHARGLRRMMQTFGTKNLYYPKSADEGTTSASLISYARRSTKVQHHQAIDSSKKLEPPKVTFGPVKLEVLWPEHNQIDSSNENNNSIVLALTLGQVTFVLTGDAEAPNWSNISVPATTRVFQAPHHGARNGLFAGAGGTPWVDKVTALNPPPAVVMSSHIVPHGHPHPDVVDELGRRNLGAYRTDRHYHVTFSTDGSTIGVKSSREENL